MVLQPSHLFANLLAVQLLAYLDPGSGSFIIQLVIAAFVGGLLLVKIYFNKIKAFFTKSHHESDASSQENDEPKP